MKPFTAGADIFLRAALLAGVGCSVNHGERESRPLGSAELGGPISSTGGTRNPNATSAEAANSGGTPQTGTQISSTGGVPAVSGSSATDGGSATSTGGTEALRTTGSIGGASGGDAATGGISALAGALGLGGTSAVGDSHTTGFTAGATGLGGASGAASGIGGSAIGGTATIGGTAGTGGTTAASCEFNISKYISSKMETVAIVEWSTTLQDVSRARIVYTLDGAAPTIINKGGSAPAELTNSSHRTLLLGLKQSSTYTFHIEATAANGVECTSPEETLTTGSLSGAPSVTRTVSNVSAQAGGFIVTSSGQGASGAAYIVDADGAVVWSAAAPNQCTRAHMDYEGRNMWMLALNVSNAAGEMRYVSMDGQSAEHDIIGLSKAHHDFTVLPGGIVAAMSWVGGGADPESELLERAPDGTITSRFRIGSNLYAGGPSAMGGSATSYHCNYIVYHAQDETYTIGDRNPSLFVKVSRTGSPRWQIGGSCSNTLAPQCAAGTWKVNHGHDFDPNGNLVVFNNGQAGAAHVLEFRIRDSTTFGIDTVRDYVANATSSSLGDVQRLPNGNTLITLSDAGQIIEVDAAWKTVQLLKGNFGYAGWRETLYGPPTRK